MEYAMASGVLAGRAIKKAKEKNDFSASSLACYDELLNNSFIIKEMNTFKNSLHLLENERLFLKYPQAISNLFEKVMEVNEKPKEGLYQTVWQEVKREFFNLETIRDWLQFRKI
jgi:electron transfer flavoprotein-quinone oxidoreductase